MVVNKKLQKGIAEAVEIIGYNNVAKDIRKAKTKKEIERNVDFVIKSNKCSKKLINPITSKLTKNPRYEKCTKFNKQLKVATKLL